MRKGLGWLAAGLMLVTALAFVSQPVPAQQQKRWAALDPNSEMSSPVVWAPTEAEARKRATEACKNLSKTCANGPASTDDMGDVFAVMCCTQPRTGCAVSAAGNRREAMRNVQKMFGDAGYSGCALKHYMSAGSGKKQ